MGQSEGSIWVGGSGRGAYVKVKVTFEADTKLASCAPNEQALLGSSGADFLIFGQFGSR